VLDPLLGLDLREVLFGDGRSEAPAARPSLAELLGRAGQVTGPIENGGRSGGYYTGVSGITVYTGDALPEEFRGNAFIGEVANNVVVRQIISRDGVGVIAHRAPGEKNREFLASKDIWFRPVQFANAPDGTLYILDMYREVIEHPASLPPPIKKHLDLTSGRDRGRLYRVVPDGFKQPPLPKLAGVAKEVLVALLQHPNGWHRDTAARLLYERQDKSAVEALAKLAHQSPLPLARMHALHVLEGLGALNEAIVLPQL